MGTAQIEEKCVINKARLVTIQCLIAATCSLACLCAEAAFETKKPDGITIVYPGQSPGSKRSDYSLELLRLALAKSEPAYQLEAYPQELPKARTFINMGAGEGIDVVWSTTSVVREELYLPVRIPIMKGLIGWRMPMVHRDNAELFAEVKDLQAFKAIEAGQLNVWTDARILEHNQVALQKASTYEGLFKMLASKRFDYFPRSILEIWQELEAHANMQFAVDKHILIYYPSAMYFFVKKDNHSLASAIEEGLESALEDGSFDALFQRYHAGVLKRSSLAKRRIFALENPLLPKATPLADERYWLDPLKY